jgi:hypothetical protein
VVLISSLSNVNKYKYVTERAGCMVGYWTPPHEVMGLNPSQVETFSFLSCSRHAVILHYTKNYCTKVLYFPKIYNHTLLNGPIASGASVDPTSQVCSSAMLILPILGCRKMFENLTEKFSRRCQGSEWVITPKTHKRRHIKSLEV